MNIYLLYLLAFLGLIKETPIQLDRHVLHRTALRKHMLGLETEAHHENYNRELKKLMINPELLEYGNDPYKLKPLLVTDRASWENTWKYDDV